MYGVAARVSGMWSGVVGSVPEGSASRMRPETQPQQCFFTLDFLCDFFSIILRNYSRIINVFYVAVFSLIFNCRFFSIINVDYLVDFPNNQLRIVPYAKK